MNKPRILAGAVAATLGAAVPVHATQYNATLTGVASFSNNGSAAGNLTSSTATWQYDDVTQLLTQTGGTYNVRFTTAPTSTLFRHSITGLVIGNNSIAGGTDYTCTEGIFGSGVGASICGNYSFGANFANDSTSSWGPGTAFARTLGGDDVSIGQQQSIAAYNAFTTTSLVGTTLLLSNAACTPAGNGCTNANQGGFNAGYRWTLSTQAPTAADDGPIAVTEGVAQIIPVGANDTNFTNPVTITIETQPTKGTITAISPPGPPAGMTITYTANIGAVGPDSFVYRMTDTAPANDTATVTLNISPVVDSTPAEFTFTDQTNVALSTLTTSQAITVAGINVPTMITIVGGAYSIDAGAFTALDGTVSVGQTVTVRQISSATPSTASNTTVTIGGVADTFTSTTAAVTQDSVPDPFTFNDVVGVPAGTVQTSNVVTITGIDTAATISVVGGEYSIGCTTPFTMAAGIINNGETVCVQQTSAAASSGITRTTLTIGGVSDTFSTVTASSGGGGGALDGFSLFALGLMGWMRRKISA